MAIKDVPSQKSTLQVMCDELRQMGDILACYVVNKDGRLLGASYGEWIAHDEKLKADLSRVASEVWGGVDRLATVGGPLKMVALTFEKFKVLGIPIEKTNTLLLLTVEVKLDSEVLRGRVLDFVSYWLKVNRYIK